MNLKHDITVTVTIAASSEELVAKHVQWWRERSAKPETEEELLAKLDQDEVEAAVN